MIERLLKKFLKDEIRSIRHAVQTGKKDVKSGKMDKREYEYYLRMTFQYYLEYILGIKIDIAIPE